MRKRTRLAQNKDDLHDLGSGDLLSRFSDDILVSILSYLPLKDAVVTSKLSKRWRYLWCQTVRLHFEDKDRLNKLGTEPYFYFARRNKYVDLCFAERNNYINWVNRIIRQHKSPTIDEFKICFDLDKDAKGAIGKWIEFAISKSVQTLELDLRRNKRICGDRNCVFPYKIFDRKCGTSLKRQSLNVPVMEIKFLKVLILKYVDVNEEGLKKILSNCPVLEHLSIHGSRHMVKAKIHGKGLALKILEISSCVGLQSIEIRDSNIVSFTCDGSLVTLKLDNLQKLEKISIGENNSSWKRINRLFCQISCCIPYLQVLEFGLYCPEETIQLPFIDLPNLKQLILKVGAWGDDSLLGLTSFVEAFPNLQRFTIQVIWFRPVKTYREVRQVAKHPHQHLEVVEIYGYYGRTSDLELATYFIKNCVTLKKLVIDINEPVVESNTQSTPATNEISKENAARTYTQLQLEPRMPVGVELVIL